MSKYVWTALALLWLLIAAAWMSADRDWWVPLGAFAGAAGAALNAWENESLRNTVRRLASGGRWRA